MSFHIGQKVVCVNDHFQEIVKELYLALPIKDEVYVIRDLELGIGIAPDRVPKVTVLLIGIVNPYGPPPASRERGFDSDRFRPVEEVPTVAMAREIMEYMDTWKDTEPLEAL